MNIKELLNEGKKKLIKNNINDAFLQAKILMQYILKESRKFFSYKWAKRNRNSNTIYLYEIY